ncbi:sigma-E factor negative regulatory protein [Halomonas sp. 18H]|uniref:sigma-E factor negative regulatory protein n=1 Tax=Halomonas almeriensis TaxID=308163 RepID=UPI00222F4F37|nr:MULTISPECIES: sigma-E factor negative regulatory protein [Halomonas]MCW4152835.1 sigma-E factor negative regulatory protein [Halomonas sp. 18H]MDN3551875.1 sigma-E factor negative regulatory protein [Halomonas almeriensis]
MSQNARESLSALMDNEGDELELRRVLKSLDDEPDAADAWRRYHLMRSMMHHEADTDTSVDLSAGIMARLQDEPVPVAEPAGSARRSMPLARSAGIAAAVSLMVITGVQFYNGASPLDNEASAPLATSTGSGSSAGTTVSPSRFNDGSLSGSGGASLASDGSLPGSGGASLASFPSASSLESPATSSRIPSLADLPMFQSRAAGRGLMTVGAPDSPMMMSPSQRQSMRMDQQQARLLQSYLDRHAEGSVGGGMEAWMPLLRSSTSESLVPR